MTQVEKDAFENWAKDKLIEYAICSVPYRPGMTQRLVFGVFVAGGYKVTRGNETLYDGGSFSSAQSAFNSAARDVPRAVERDRMPVPR